METGLDSPSMDSPKWISDSSRERFLWRDFPDRSEEILGEGEPNDRGLPKGICGCCLEVRISSCSCFRVETFSMSRINSSLSGIVVEVEVLSVGSCLDKLFLGERKIGRVVNSDLGEFGFATLLAGLRRSKILVLNFLEKRTPGLGRLGVLGCKIFWATSDDKIRRSSENT